jgi:hypothetical protein
MNNKKLQGTSQQHVFLKNIFAAQVTGKSKLSAELLPVPEIGR